jgi:hypothetical protein
LHGFLHPEDCKDDKEQCFQNLLGAQPLDNYPTLGTNPICNIPKPLYLPLAATYNMTSDTLSSTYNKNTTCYDLGFKDPTQTLAQSWQLSVGAKLPDPPSTKGVFKPLTNVISTIPPAKCKNPPCLCGKTQTEALSLPFTFRCSCMNFQNFATCVENGCNSFGYSGDVTLPTGGKGASLAAALADQYSLSKADYLKYAYGKQADGKMNYGPIWDAAANPVCEWFANKPTTTATVGTATATAAAAAAAAASPATVEAATTAGATTAGASTAASAATTAGATADSAGSAATTAGATAGSAGSAATTAGATTAGAATAPRCCEKWSMNQTPQKCDAKKAAWCLKSEANCQGPGGCDGTWTTDASIPSV